jgi:hypothetical protein
VQHEHFKCSFSSCERLGPRKWCPQPGTRAAASGLLRSLPLRSRSNFVALVAQLCRKSHLLWGRASRGATDKLLCYLFGEMDLAMLGSQRCCGAVTVTASPRSRRQSSCATRRRACRQLAHSFGPPSSSSASSSSSVCPALGILQPIHVTASNADGAGHWRRPRPVPALQREEPVGATGSTLGRRHQADTQTGSQCSHECQPCVGQLTTVLLLRARGPRTTGPFWPDGLESTH